MARSSRIVRSEKLPPSPELPLDPLCAGAAPGAGGEVEGVEGEVEVEVEESVVEGGAVTLAEREACAVAESGAVDAASEDGLEGAWYCAKTFPNPSPTRRTGLKDQNDRARGYRESRRWQSSHHGPPG